MIETILLSFIVPVYNVEKYLNECLNSIFDPSVDEADYEVIAVDDGSTDSSPEILRGYEHHRNFHIITQENGGQSSARNTGIKAAKGKYISFVDSDDYLLPGVMPMLLGFTRKSDCDIIGFGLDVMVETDEQGMVTVGKIHSPTLSGVGKSIFREWIKQTAFNASACGKLCKRDFLNANSLYFFKLSWGEDAEWQARCFFYAEKIASQPFSIYGYRRRPNSIITNLGSPKLCYAKMELSDALNNFRESIKPSEENADFLIAMGDLVAFFLDNAIGLMYQYFPKNDRKAIRCELKKRMHLLALATYKKRRGMYKLTCFMPAYLAFKMHRFD